MTTVISDVKYALRQMRQNPGFTLMTVLTLALGVAVNAAVFGVLYRVALKPLPYPQSGRLMQVKVHSPEMNRPDPSLTAREYLTLAAECKAFTSVAGYSDEIKNLSGLGVPLRAFGTRVSQGFFDTFGISPSLGRAFSQEEYSAGPPAVVLISHQLWRGPFGGREDIVGQSVLLDGSAAVVCGVMPADFSFPYRHTTYWTPLVLTAEETQETDNRLVCVVGRLDSGVSPYRLQEHLQRAAQGYQAVYALPQTARVTFTAAALLEECVGPAGRVLWILFGAVSCVTLIGTANLVNLQISRLLARRQEFATRMAVGAGVGRIVRQWLAECSVMSLLAASLGLALAYWCIQLLRVSAPYGLPRADEIRLDGAVMGYGFVLSLVLGAGVPVLPLLHFLRGGPTRNVVLKSHERDGGLTGRRSRPWLVAAQAIVATVLLIGASLLGSSFRNVMRIDPGFSPAHLLSARVVLPPGTLSDDDACRGFYRRLFERLAALPGVAGAGLVNSLPLSEIHFLRPFTMAGMDSEQSLADQGLMRGDYTMVSLDYFRLMGIRLLAGRSFQPTDENGAPVAIVSQALARQFWGGADVIGRQIKLGPGPWLPWMTIVGVVADVKSHGQDAPSEPAFYVPYTQKHLPTHTMRGMFVVVKTRATPEVVVHHIRAELRSLDPDLALANIETMDDRLEESVAGRCYQARLMGVFAALALILVLVGVFGVVSCTVGDRRRELGIRMALGASPLGLFTLILKQGLRPVLVGIGLGWLVSLTLHRVLSGLLFGISASDPRVFFFVGALLVAAATLACYLPARKATQFDPMVALRYE
ncbi:MAG: ABC transporter permease [Planctomycetes bacterium]|jgi:predicted permease|nr:ABC transporter permease [Planctomycetota bacterium]